MSSLPPKTDIASGIAPSGLAVSSSRAFRSDPSSPKSAILRETLRVDRQPYGLVCLRNDLLSFFPVMPKLQGLVERLLRTIHFCRSQSRGSGPARQAYGGICLPDLRVVPTSGFLDAAQCRSIKVVHALPHRLRQFQRIRLGFVAE